MGPWTVLGDLLHGPRFDDLAYVPLYMQALQFSDSTGDLYHASTSNSPDRDGGLVTDNY